MSKNEVLNFLKSIELFRDLSDEELELIFSMVEENFYERDSELFVENRQRQKLFLIYDGKVRLYKMRSFGAEKALSYFGKFDFMGEGALLDSYPHSTTARAVQDSIVLTIHRDRFQETLREYPQLGVKVISTISRVIARRMRQATSQIADIATQYVSGQTRREHDLLGYRDVPFEAYYGIQTLRGMENFHISGVGLNHHPAFIVALAQVKMAAAKANFEVGMLSHSVHKAIVEACQEIIEGKWHTHFVVDMVQGGAGTSTNMNANEVIANRALEIMGHHKGEYDICHPNNHVNLSQSTNDAYPTALKIAFYYRNQKLVKVLRELVDSMYRKAEEFKNVIKMGRTQLQDAVPMTLGQEFEAFGATLREEVKRLETNARLLLEVNIGGTAIGTGLNADPVYIERVIEHLGDITGLPLLQSSNLVEATQDTGAFVMFSSTLKRLAIKLSKICNDLRLLSSGPRAGFNEINLPKMQPGSSIMPGKVNPVIPELVNQVAFKVIGNDLTVTMAAEAGQLQLNVMEPIIAQSIFENFKMLKAAMATLRYRCIDGITANEDICRKMVENSIGLVTALTPVLGYEVCSELAAEALDTGNSLYNLVLEKELISKEKLEALLKPENMLGTRK